MPLTMADNIALAALCGTTQSCWFGVGEYTPWPLMLRGDGDWHKMNDWSATSPLSQSDFTDWCPTEPDNAGGRTQMTAAYWRRQPEIGTEWGPGSTCWSDIHWSEFRTFRDDPSIGRTSHLLCACPAGPLSPPTPPGVPPSPAPPPQTFVVTTQRYTWNEARARCVAMGRELANILSSTENAAANLAFETSGINADRAWIGASDAQNEGRWQWTDSGTLPPTSNPANAYSNWHSGSSEPNGGRSENCALMWHSGSGQTAGTWNDEGCGSQCPAICELTGSRPPPPPLPPWAPPGVRYPPCRTAGWTGCACEDLGSLFGTQSRISSTQAAFCPHVQSGWNRGRATSHACRACAGDPNDSVLTGNLKVYHFESMVPFYFYASTCSDATRCECDNCPARTVLSLSTPLRNSPQLILPDTGQI